MPTYIGFSQEKIKELFARSRAMGGCAGYFYLCLAMDMRRRASDDMLDNNNVVAAHLGISIEEVTARATPLVDAGLIRFHAKANCYELIGLGHDCQRPGRYPGRA